MRTLAFFAAALALSACGSSAGAGESASTLLAQTFGGQKSVHSGQIALTVNLDLHGIKSLSGPTSFKLDGPFQSHGAQQLPDFSLSLIAGGALGSFNAGLVSAQRQVFIQLAGTSYVLPSALTSSLENAYLSAQRKAAKQHGSTFAAFGIDPRQWVTGARNVGSENVGGTQTEHVTASIDVRRFLADVNKLLGRASQLGVSSVASAPTSISPAAQAAIAAAVRTAQVDVWTGSSDHVLRRLRINVSLAVPPAERAAVSGLSSGTISLDLLLSNLNQAQQISAPAGAKPLSSLTSALGGLTGGGGSGSGGATSSTGSVAPQGYLDCVKRAKGSVSAIQKCAPLLGGG